MKLQTFNVLLNIFPKKKKGLINQSSFITALPLSYFTCFFRATPEIQKELIKSKETLLPKSF
jgi:hypothetical protein